MIRNFFSKVKTFFTGPVIEEAPSVKVWHLTAIVAGILFALRCAA